MPLLVVVAIAVVYLLMLINTNQVILDVEDIMRSNVPMEITRGRPTHRYNRQDEHDVRTVSYYVRIDRRFVLHDFSNGYMWIKYYREGYDNEGNRMYGSWGIPARWKIQKIGGEWEIVEIFEDP